MLEPRRSRDEGEEAPLSAATVAVWGGEGDAAPGSPTQVPIVYSAACGYADVEGWQAVAQGERPGHIYGRSSHGADCRVYSVGVHLRGREPRPPRARP